MKSRILWFALACHLALSLGYLFLTPVFEGPDENDHYRYAFHIANTGEAPIPRGAAARLNRPVLDENGLAIHPPLYYRILAKTLSLLKAGDVMPAPVLNPGLGDPGQHLRFLHGRDEIDQADAGVAVFHLLRGWSVLFGLLSIVLVYRLARLVCPERQSVADTAALIVACLPMWSFIHGVLNAGNLSVLICQAALVVMAGVILRERVRLRDAIVLGTLIGVALITKLTGLFLGVLLLAILGHLLHSHAGERRRVGVFALLSISPVALIAGPHFYGNFVDYGDPLLLAAHRATFETTLVPEGRVVDWLVEGFFPQIFSSLLGQLGWFSLPPPKWLSILGAAVSVVALLGVVRTVIQSRTPRLFVFLSGTALLVFALVLQFNLEFRQPQGRLLFPAIGPLAVLFALGLLAHFPDHKGFGVLVFVPPSIGFAILAWHFHPVFDPASAPASTHHSSLVIGVTRRNPAPRIRLTVPVENPPTLRWHDLTAPPGAVYTIYVFDENRRIWGATFEWTSAPRLELRGPEFRLPAAYWDALPKPRNYLLKVRRLPDRTRGVAWFEESNLVRISKD